MAKALNITERWDGRVRKSTNIVPDRRHFLLHNINEVLCLPISSCFCPKLPLFKGSELLSILYFYINTTIVVFKDSDACCNNSS